MALHLKTDPQIFNMSDKAIVQGQAGAQAMEDAAALGLVFSDFHSTDAKSISERLEIFERIRVNHASVIQLISDNLVLAPEKLTALIQPYMPEEKVPGE